MMPGKIIDTLAAAAPLPPRHHCVLRLAIVRTFDCALQPIHAALGELTMLRLFSRVPQFLHWSFLKGAAMALYLKLQNSESSLHKFRQEIHQPLQTTTYEDNLLTKGRKYSF